MKVYKHTKSAQWLWNIKGSFGDFDVEVKSGVDSFYADNGCISVKTEILRYDNGVCVRKDTVKNISDKEVVFSNLSSKFTFDGGEYEVYSQANCWQNESEGGWQPLTTAVSAFSKSIRNASNAVPFMVLWSNQQNRGTVFHLKAYSAWKMRISRIFMGGEVTCIEAEMGIYNDALSLKLNAGEVLELPEVIYYEALNKTDMDCFKLHSHLNEMYPRKELPVIYNSWLYKFDRFTYSDIISQIKKAKELGVEYFVIDAGWFGEGEDWGSARGDWYENQTFGFRGRMTEIAEQVRKSGMKFGFWLEPECASKTADIVKKYPDYFLEGKNNSYFIDFANDEAKGYIFSKTCELIDKFGAEFVKFDFNDDLNYDKYGTGFTKYFKGYCDYIKKLRERYPDLYIENCASGGMRMTVRDGELFDSFWPTDNQSPYYSLRIFKDTLLRMPPQWINGWISVRSAEKFSYAYGTNEMDDKLFATNDATWSNVASVSFDYLEGFMKGRSVALSFDLTSLSEEVFEKFKAYISEFKNERDFWKKAVCHILVDTKTMLVLEFRNADFSKIEIVAFSGKSKQDNICIYPVLDKNAEYEMDGKVISENEINIPITMPHAARIVRISKKNTVD